MTFDHYMNIHNLSNEEMASRLGKDRTMIGRYRRGEVIPPPDVIRRIQEETNLAVQFNDWFVSSPQEKAS